MKSFLKVFTILFFPLAVFALFTWKWWESLWKGGVIKKTFYLTLLPVYGLLFLILNITHKD
jgi:hypothetical protein